MASCLIRIFLPTEAEGGLPLFARSSQVTLNQNDRACVSRSLGEPLFIAIAAPTGEVIAPASKHRIPRVPEGNRRISSC